MARRAAIASPPAIAARAAIVLLAVFFAAASAPASATERASAPVVTVAPPDGWKLGGARHDGAELPGGGEMVQELVPPAGARVTAARVLVGLKRLSAGELEAASTERHGATVKNRAAWGMQLSAGPPREELQLDGRRALRYRDRVGGALGHSEQSFTCEVISGLLACVQITAPPDARDRADAFAAALFASLKIKR